MYMCFYEIFVFTSQDLNCVYGPCDNCVMKTPGGTVYASTHLLITYFTYLLGM